VTLLISIFVSDILPIFIVVGVGFLLARSLGTSVKTLAHVSFYALAPCLVFDTLVTSKLTGPQVGRMALLVVLVGVAMGVLARIVAIPFRLSRTELIAFLLVVMFSNSGNYGLPVVLFAFGTEALSHATVYFVTSSAFTYTVGSFLAGAGRRSAAQAALGIARVPAIYGVAVALVFLWTGIPVPIAIMRPISLLSNSALPLMLLVLGMQLERAQGAKRPWLVAVAVGLSLVVAPFVALGLTSLLGLTDGARQAGVLLASMPAAVVTTILALEFDVAPTFVTNCVFVSTVLSPLTLTPLIAYLR
jgi:malate permease and related proteins